MSQMPWACNPLLTGLELAHRPHAGDFYLRTTPELSTVLPCGEIPEYETVFLCSDRKFELAFVCLIVQRQDMAFRHTVYLKPVARTDEQRKPVYLSTSLLSRHNSQAPVRLRALVGAPSHISKMVPSTVHSGRSPVGRRRTHQASLIPHQIKLDSIEDIVCRLVTFSRNLEHLSLVTDAPDVAKLY